MLNMAWVGEGYVTFKNYLYTYIHSNSFLQRTNILELMLFLHLKYKSITDCSRLTCD